jgi:outer membrane protein assembly factor BamB
LAFGLISSANGQSSKANTAGSHDDKTAKLVFGDARWSFKTNGKVFSSPLINNGVMYIGSEDGNLYAIDIGTGVLKWKFKTGGAIHSTATFHDDVVYFGSFDGHYYALEADTGKKLWSFKTGGERWMGEKGYFGMKPDSVFMADPWEYFLSSPVLHKTTRDLSIFFGSSDGNVYAVNAKTGSLKWKYKTQGIVHSTPAIHTNMLIVGCWDTYMYALNLESGAMIWKFKTGDKPGMSGIQSSPIVDHGLVYFGARDAHLYALDVQTGELRWKFFADNAWILSNAVSKDSTVYFGTSDSYLVVALNALTGREKWRSKLNGYVFSSPSLNQGNLFVGDFTGAMYSLNALDGSIQAEFETPGKKQFAGVVLNNGKLDFNKLIAGMDSSLYSSVVSVMDEFYKLGPIVSSPVIHDGVLYVGSADGYVYAISLKNSNTP